MGTSTSCTQAPQWTSQAVCRVNYCSASGRKSNNPQEQVTSWKRPMTLTRPSAGKRTRIDGETPSYIYPKSLPYAEPAAKHHSRCDRKLENAARELPTAEKQAPHTPWASAANKAVKTRRKRPKTPFPRTWNPRDSSGAAHFFRRRCSPVMFLRQWVPVSGMLPGSRGEAADAGAGCVGGCNASSSLVGLHFPEVCTGAISNLGVTSLSMGCQGVCAAKGARFGAPASLVPGRCEAGT